MKHYEPKIILKTLDLYKDFYIEIKKWPKPEKYSIGKRCEDLILDIFKNLLAASRNKEKLRYLKKANLELQIFKHLIRMIKELNIMKNKKYIFFCTKILEIGKMLGGWIKFV